MATNTVLRDRLASTRTAQQTGKPAATVFDLIERMKPELQRALPGQLDPNRFVRVALTTLRMNPGLARCKQESLLGALMLSAQLGLEPGGPLGHCYLIPYKDECTFVLGYRGMIDLARRSGKISALYAHAVHERDEFHYELGLQPALRHVPGDGDRGKVTHVYAVARFTDGSEPQFVVLTTEDVERYRKRSRAAQNGPWVTDWEAMALKTSVRRLANWLPQSIEFSTAFRADEQVIPSPATSLETLEFEQLAEPQEEQPQESAESAQDGSDPEDQPTVQPIAEGADVAHQQDEGFALESGDGQ